MYLGVRLNLGEYTIIPNFLKLPSGFKYNSEIGPHELIQLFFIQISTLTPSMHRKLIEREKFCMQK